MDPDALEYLDGWSEGSHPRDPAGRFGTAAASGVAEHVAEHLTGKGTEATASGPTVEHKTGKIHIGAGGARHYAGGHEVAPTVEENLKSHPTGIVKKWAERSGHTLGKPGSAHPSPIRSGPMPPDNPNKSAASKVGEEIGYQLGEHGIKKAVKYILSKAGEVGTAAGRIKRRPGILDEDDDDGGEHTDTEQERVPAGQPGGGEFAGGGGGSAGMSEERYKHLVEIHAGESQWTPQAKAERMALSEEEKAQYGARRQQEYVKAQAEKGRKQGQKIAKKKEKARKELAELTKTIGEETIKTYGPGSDHADAAPRVQRFDFVPGGLRPAEKTPEGWLRCEGYTARCGILEYEDGAGNVRRELVLPEELGDPESMASARMVPYTNTHPQALLDDKTARLHQVGSVGENIRMDGDRLAAPIMITDGDTVRDVETGRRQLSWGYDCQLAPPDPSLFAKWGQHDGIQRGRRYNHLAGVDEARAGVTASLRLDSSAARMVAFSSTSASPQEPAMSQVQIGTHRFDAKPETASLIQQAIDTALGEAKARADAALAEKTAALGAVTIATKRADTIAKIAKGKIGRVRSLLDAMKARMMDCDECGGSGHVDDVDPSNLAQNAAIRKCDYCDGSGKVRMHDAIKSMSSKESEPSPDDDMEAMGEEMKDDDLERESAAEEGLERAANPEHKDRAAKRKDARKVLQQKRADALERRADRRSIVRAALLTTASKYLGAEEKFDGKADVEVQRAVVAKLAPHLDAAKMDAAQVGLFFAAEVKRADAAGGDPLTPSDRLREGLNYVPPVGQRIDSAEAHQQFAATMKANAWQTPGQRPTMPLNRK